MKTHGVRFSIFVLLLQITSHALFASDKPSIDTILDYQDLPDLPVALEGASLGLIGGSLITVGGQHDSGPNTNVYVLTPDSTEWKVAGEWSKPQVNAGYSSDGSQLILGGGLIEGEACDAVTRFSLTGTEIQINSLASLPEPMPAPAILIEKGTLYLASASNQGNRFAQLSLGVPEATWQNLPDFPGQAREGATLLRSFDNRLYLIGGTHSGQPVLGTLEYSIKDGWVEKAPILDWVGQPSAVAFGESHLLVFGATDHDAILAYHTITNRWIEVTQWENAPKGEPIVTTSGDQVWVIAGADARKILVSPLKTKYGWIDHSVVILYLVAMVGIGVYFTNKEKDTADYFQGGKKIPWWATGMSLFATMASAISLMTMPGKSYAGNWEWFMVSIFSAITLPISLFILAPIIRKLNIRTSNEYLEYRFGIVARMLGSMIFVLFQMLGRMAPVMLLPSIALNAITGISIEICILVMAAVTISYTFMGGLSAVIWTDTIQGFIMVGTIAACLIMAIIQLNTPIDEALGLAREAGKLRMLDWNWDLTYPTIWLFFIGTLFTTLNNIGDQNFVQRVQCTSSLRETQKAVGLQMSVAVPINFLLFAVGTALFLYYQKHPEQLNPSMKSDGVYPFFAAQHLPIGVSGLVVAALLAATMSTISSAICSVANLGVDDFYRRFSKTATETSSVLVGRLLTLVIGFFGTGAALFLANADMPSVWDLALFLTNLVSNGLVGMFALGLITRRANQLGTIIGVITGMTVVFLIQKNTAVNFWLFMPIGSTVTFIVGYLVSLAIPAKARNIQGLTIYTINQPRQP